MGSINGSVSAPRRDAGKITQDYGRTMVKGGQYKQRRKVGRKIYTAKGFKGRRIICTYDKIESKRG